MKLSDWLGEDVGWVKDIRSDTAHSTDGARIALEEDWSRIDTCKGGTKQLRSPKPI